MTAWPGLKSWDVNDEALFGDFNTYIRDALDNLYNAPLCMVSRSTNQSIPTFTGPLTYVTWTVEDEDPYGFHAASSTNLVVPAGLGGLYVIFATLELASSAGDGSYVYSGIGVNSFRIANDSQPYPSAANVSLGFATIYPLAAGDTVSVEIEHDSATAKNLLSGTYAPRFGLVMVGP